MAPFKEHHVVSSILGSSRLSDYCTGVFRTIKTRKGIKKAIQRGQVSLNGKQGYTGDYVSQGDIIILEIATDEPMVCEDERLIKIHYQDKYLAIVEKPAGIVVSGIQKRTLEKILPNSVNLSILEDALHAPQAIHRLDYPTTGIVLFGKTYEAVRMLNSYFEQRTITKGYHAVVIGHIDDEGIINHDVEGRSALTIFNKTAEIQSSKYGMLNLVKIKLETGRKHQIRTHFHSIGNPVLGDKQYFIEEKISYGNGLYLHASSMKFIHPFTNESIEVDSQLPWKFERLFPSK